MTTSKLLIHPEKNPLIMVRKSYLDICADAPNPHCASGILAVFEYWTEHKLKKHPATEAWIYKSNAELASDMLGLFSLSKVKKNLPWLIETGLLCRRSNPKNPWDRTYQYLLVVSTVQLKLDELIESPISTNALGETNDSIGSGELMEKLKQTNRIAHLNQSLSESTTESTVAEISETKITESESTNRGGGVTGSHQIEDLQTAPPSETFDDFLNTLLEVCKKSTFDWNRIKYRPIAQAYWDKHYRIQHLDYVDKFVKDGRFHFSDINPEQIGDVFDEATQIYGEGQPDDTGLFDTTMEDSEQIADMYPVRPTSRHYEPPVHSSASQPISSIGKMTFKDAWLAAKGQLELQLNRATYDTWIADTKFYSFEDGILTLYTRNNYAQDWIVKRLSRSIMHIYSGISQSDLTGLTTISHGYPPITTQRQQSCPVEHNSRGKPESQHATLESPLSMEKAAV